MQTNSGAFDIAIVGAGPTGAILANLLGQYGLSVVVLERNHGVMDIPRAVHFDGETMRVFQSANLATQILPIVRPGYSMHWVNAAGQTLLVRKGHIGLGDQGWHNDYYFHQPQLEAVLREGLNRFSSVQLREGVDVRGYSESADDVLLELCPAGGTATTETVRAKYVVGCDGARSTVRTWIGDSHEDLGQHQAWLVVDGVLNHPLPLPEHSVQHCNPARPATSIYVHPLRRRWEIQVMPDDDPGTLTDPAHVWKLLEPWVKPTQARLERAATYVFHSLVAHEWQRGRLMIAGDAAHQTPPFLGQGLCAGVRDAANLAWKLAQAVRMGKTGLLETYGVERKPHAREFIQLAVDVGKIIQVTDPAQAAERDKKLLTEGLEFNFPRPKLGTGAYRGETPAGQIFIQPMLEDGRWMDDVAGNNFALLVHPHHAGSIKDAVRSKAKAAGVVVLEAPGKEAAHWLEERNAAAVMVRPDRYIFEVISNAAALEASIAHVTSLH